LGLGSLICSIFYGFHNRVGFGGVLGGPRNLGGGGGLTPPPPTGTPL